VAILVTCVQDIAFLVSHHDDEEDVAHSRSSHIRREGYEVDFSEVLNVMSMQDSRGGYVATYYTPAREKRPKAEGGFSSSNLNDRHSRSPSSQ
jgi:hypothetical protein